MCSAHHCCKIFVQRECRSDCRAKGGHPVVTEAELMVAFLGGKLTPMAARVGGRVVHAVLTGWLGAAVVFRVEQGAPHQSFGRGAWLSSLSRALHLHERRALRITGEWCGVSYQAYVDFISERHDLAVYTVDADYGCGVIRKLAEPSPESATAAGAELLGDWRNKRDDPMEAFAFFDPTSRFC